MSERVVVATVNPHAWATLGSVYSLAAVMHSLAQFPGVYVQTTEEQPTWLTYVVDASDPEPEPEHHTEPVTPTESERA